MKHQEKKTIFTKVAQELELKQEELLLVQENIEKSFIYNFQNEQLNIITIKLKRLYQEKGFYYSIIHLYKHFKRKYQQKMKYQEYIEQKDLTPKDIEKLRKQLSKLALLPKFSIIMPVYNVDAEYLEKAINSVCNQIYPYWELCIVDDASSAVHIRKILEKYLQLDERIKVIFRSENGNISAASNSALEIATEEYIALLDHDDELTQDALSENAKLINLYPDADFIYSDEDKIDSQGKRLDPFFKPDWSPDYFHACMYTCHLGVYRNSLLKTIGGFRSEYDGAQDYDLVLRIVEKTNKIYHIPKILYHWRVIPASAASTSDAKPWAYIAAKKALEEMINRSSYPGWVEAGERAGFFRVRRNIIDNPLISIIIPSAGKRIETSKHSFCLLENCLASIQKQSSYRNFEIIVVDGYDLPNTTLENIASPQVKLVRCSEPFNFSARINKGRESATGEFLLLLNDDIEVTTPDWLESLLELSQQSEIGAVGAKLLYPQGTIQHSGVVILDGNPGHVYYGFERDHPGYFLSNLVNRNYLAVTGACLMMRGKLYDRLGGLDEDFPLNYNDVDLCLKAYQKGFRNVVTPYVKLIHYESASREKGLRPGEWQKLDDKWGEYLQKLQGDPYYNPNLSKDAKFEVM